MNDFEVSKICRALGDENRLKIISLLVKGEKCACELLEKFRITQPTLSHHMKILSDCELVQSRKDGKWTFYEINCCRFKEFKQYFEAIQCWKDNLPASSGDGGKSCCCIISPKNGQKIPKITNLQYNKGRANYGTKKKSIYG